MASARQPQRGENLPVGLLLAVIAVLCMALQGVFAKAAAPGVPVHVIVFFQFAIAFLLLTPFAMRRGFAGLKTARIGLHTLRAVTGSVAWLTLFIAINMMPLTNAVLLNFAAPIFMPLVAWMVSRQRVKWPVWVGVFVGFAGIALVLHPSNAELNWGAPIALFGAVLIAVTLLSVRWLDETESDFTILFYYFLISTLVMLPVAVVGWSTPEPWTWIYLAGIGLAQFVSQVTLYMAYRRASPVVLAPTLYLAIIFTALINWMIWDRPPTWLEAGGIVLVIAGGVIAMRKNGNAKHGA